MRENLDALGRGPNRNEVDVGLRSTLPDESRFPDVSVSRGTATVDLGRRFTALSGEDQVIALAQLVYTITGQPGIGLVRFTLDGRPTEVPRANGELTAGSRMTLAPWRRARAVTAAMSAVWMSGLVGASMIRPAMREPCAAKKPRRRVRPSPVPPGVAVFQSHRSGMPRVGQIIFKGIIILIGREATHHPPVRASGLRQGHAGRFHRPPLRDSRDLDR